jgi:hypothetical protein
MTIEMKTRTADVTNSGHRTSFRFDVETWDALDDIAISVGMSWDEWATEAIEANPTATKAAAVRYALQSALRNEVSDAVDGPASAPEGLVLGRKAAAELLAQQFEGRSVKQWTLYLFNNANKSRSVGYRIPVEYAVRSPFYRLAELEKFVEFERQRRAGKINLTGQAAEIFKACVINAGKTSKGRLWKSGSVEYKDGVIQLVTNDPFMVFALTPEEAIEFGQQLIRTVEEAIEFGQQLIRTVEV